MSDDPRIDAILDFWFGPEGSTERGTQRMIWWTTDTAFDAEVADVLGPLLNEARSGALDHWAETPEGATALILLLDQAPRNLFRSSAEAFASDASALAVSERAIERGFHTRVMPVFAQFLAMPMMHCEDAAVQDRCVELFDGIGVPDAAKAARQHHAVIARFGRFPHRNAVLGRTNTADEQAYLDDPGRPTFAGGTTRPDAEPT